MNNEKYPWHSAHTEELTEKQRSRYAKLKSEGLCVSCSISPAVVMSGSGGNGGKTIKYCQECREKLNVARSAHRLTIKKEVLAHYGPHGILQCAWDGCIVTDVDMLSLDHINNDGNDARGG